MLKIKEAVIVEGKYDKIKLSSIIDAVIVETDGFGIFNDKGKMELIRFYAENTGIILMTDSDSSGFKIRNYIKGSIKRGRIVHVYIPDIYGKEHRKEKASKEGKLGVEGISVKIIIEAFQKAGINVDNTNEKSNKIRVPIKKTDFFELGLTGAPNSSGLRSELLKRLNLPERLTSKGLLDALNVNYDKESLMVLLDDIKGGV